MIMRLAGANLLLATKFQLFAPEGCSSSAVCGSIAGEQTHYNSMFIYNVSRTHFLCLGAAIACAGMLPISVQGQGCVQSRGAGIGLLMQGEDTYLKPGQWQAGVGYRWLHSDRHF